MSPVSQSSDLRTGLAISFEKFATSLRADFRFAPLNAMSRQAQAERERQSRIILGTAETEIAEKFARASEYYRDNPVALHLRAMNMVYEGLRRKGSMIIVPSTAVETMGLGALGGLTAFGKEILHGQPADAEAHPESGDTPGETPGEPAR